MSARKALDVVSKHTLSTAPESKPLSLDSGEPPEVPPDPPEVTPDPRDAITPPAFEAAKPTVRNVSAAPDRRDPPPGWKGSYMRCGACGDFLPGDRCERCAPSPVAVATPPRMT